MSLRSIYYKLPPAFRFLARKIYFLPQDITSNKSINGIPIPPKGLIYTGGGSFIETGNRYFKYFKEYGNITPQSHILDVGSGIGRMAIPLTQYLTHGKYEGFDAIKQGVDWCQQEISARYPNFSFRYIPLLNDLYRNDGIAAETFVFPYESDEFDLVYLISVFTHMLPVEVENYLSEIYRVLKPRARCLASFFIMDDNSEAKMMEGNFQFKHNLGNYFLFDKKVKHANVAYSKEYLESLFSKIGFESVHFFRGNWSGADASELDEFQDIYVLRK